MSVVARQWDPDVSLSREFRAFVVAGELVAVSQYDDQLMYHFVVEHSYQIVVAIRECIRLIKSRLQALSFASPNMGIVVDFLVVPAIDRETRAIDPDMQWQARVIELNPFGPMTGASLFCWNY